jgi:hypothetical protein
MPVFSAIEPIRQVARLWPIGYKIAFLPAMHTVRARLAVLTLMLLTQQTLALAMAGALACCETAPPQAAQMECCKNGGGDGHMCPLTKRRPPDEGCRMTRGCSSEPSGVLAGAGFVYAAPLVGGVSIEPPDAAPVPWRAVRSEEALAGGPPPTPPPKR